VNIGRFAVSPEAQLPLRARGGRIRGPSLRFPATWAAVTSLILAAAGVSGYYALRSTSWAVMTDELQVVRLAESIADRLSPVPYIHGVYYGALSQLYPLLLAPFFGLLSAPSAETAAHALNAVLLPSAGWPAFLLARSVTHSRGAGLAAAALTAFTPWLVLTSTLLTENAAYPAFVWAVFLCHRALAAPSPRRDLVALVGLALVFFARTQLLVVVVALPASLVWHEVRSPRNARQSLSAHRVLAAAYALGAVGATAVAAFGSLAAVVGNYAVPFSGDLLPSGIWSSAAAHLDHVVVGCAILPFVLAVGWSAVALIRPHSEEAHAFAVLFALLVPLLTLEVASFDLRFTPNAFVQDRYLFYLAPLFAVGSAAALSERTSLRVRVVTTVAALAFFAWLLTLAAYDDHTIIFWASPAAAFHSALVDAGGAFHLSAGAFVAIAAAVFLAMVLVLQARNPRLALVVTTAVTAALGALQALYVFERYSDHAMTRSQKLGGVPRDWIDKALPDSSSVALVPSPHDNHDFWWEAELWNKKADRVLRINGGPTFSPFPAEDVGIRFRSGVLAGAQPSEFLVVSPSETRFHLLETAVVFDVGALRLVRVSRPYRLDWATRAVSADGWTRPGHRATLRFYGHGDKRLRIVDVLLSSSRSAALPLKFTLLAPGAVRRGSVDPGGARPPVSFSLCVPARGFVDVTLDVAGAVRIPDGRLVGLHIDRIAESRSGACVPAQVSSL